MVMITSKNVYFFKRKGIRFVFVYILNKLRGEDIRVLKGRYWIMYEVLIKLYYELDYRKFTIKELKDIKEILEQFNGKTEEVKVRRVKEKWEQ